MIEIIRHKIERCLIYFRPGRSFAYKVISGPWLPAARYKQAHPAFSMRDTYLSRIFYFTNENFGDFYNITNKIIMFDDLQIHNKDNEMSHNKFY